MNDELAVRAITVDTTRNRLALHLTTPGSLSPGQTELATLDVGTGGRLLGVDLHGRYLAVSDPRPADMALARAVATSVELHHDAGGHLTAVGLPRRGEGYEITYPSGNR